jgi:predicted nucleotide-binding protein (sugar kinase/HSP70/actin superfamily)
MYANIKIDQALNIGSIRVRIRSLVAAHSQQLALISAQKKRNALAEPA